MRTCFAFVLFLVGITLPIFSHAQLGATSLVSSGPEIALQPPFPEPNQSVQASLNNLLTSYYTAEIRWFLDGVELPGTANLREVNLVAGELGDTQELSATITSSNGATETLQYNIVPVYLDIIVEPQTHVPEFYQGRPLPSVGSMVNLTAVLNGTTVGSADLIYTWRVNNEVLGGAGSRGQYKASFVSPLDTRIVVSLDITNLRGERIARRSSILTNVNPMLKFYEVHPLYGISHLATKSTVLSGSISTLRAEPYYLDSRVYNDPDAAVWKIDGYETKRPQNPYEITLERVSETRGSSNAEFQVQSTTNLLQGIRSNVTIYY